MKVVLLSSDLPALFMFEKNAHTRFLLVFYDFSFSNNFTVSFDESFVLANNDTTLRLAFIDYNIYLAVTPESSRTVTPIAILTLER